MKKFFDLYPSITTFDNLYLAFRKAAKGKRKNAEVASFEMMVDDNLFTLQEELINQVYQPGQYHSFTIHDPKRRVISAAPFRDRVVHHALCNIIEPIFERTFIGDSYANRKWKGNHLALERAQIHSRQFVYVLQCDIRQYFASIDHQLLLGILNKKIGDNKTIWLCHQIIHSGERILSSEYDMHFFPHDDLFATIRPRGLPIGNLTSQFWGNVYLNELDQFIKRNLHCNAYLRYVDDFLLFSNSKQQLWNWRKAIISKLQDLRLSLHENSSTVYPVKNGIPFLGFRIYPEYRRIKRRNVIAFQRRFRKAREAYKEGQISLDELSTKVQGWVAHAQHGDTWQLRRRILTDTKL